MAKSLRNTTMKVNIEVNSKALSEADKQINSTIKTTGRLEKSANQSGKAIEQAGRKYASASGSIKKNADSLRENADRARNASHEHNSLASSAKRSGDSFREQKRYIDNSSQSLKHFASAADKAKDTLATIGFGYASAKMFELGKAAIQTGMEFDKQMSAVQAVSGATAGQFKALRQQAIDLGASTTKSASEVAAGQLELAKSGFTVKQIMAAMPGVISASTASGEDMARTAEVMTAALNSFGLKASEATHVADVLAQAANDSAADINDLGYTFKYAAAPAHMLGISMEELSAATEIMSNAGIKGETAGTSLRAALLRLADPPKAAGNMLDRLGVSITNAHGKMLPFSNIIGQLHDKTKNMANAEKTMALSAIFGTEAVSGMMDVVEAGPTKLNKLTASLKDSDGASKRAADAMSDNLAGAVEQLKGAVESASISVSDTLKPAVKAGVHVVTDLVEGFNHLSPSAKSMVIWGSVIVGGVLPVSFALYKVRKAIKTVSEVMNGAKTFFGNYRAEMALTGASALRMASEVKEANAIIAASQPNIGQSVTTVAEETATKGGLFSKVGNRVKEGMRFSGKASKTVPIIGTALAGLSLVGMTKETAGQDLGGFGGSLAGGAAGAAIGSAIAPGIGTAIGGMIGSMAGTKFGSEFGATVQKKWPNIVKSIDKIAKEYPILSKTLAISNHPFAALILNGQKAAKSVKNFFKDPLNTTINFGKTANSTTSKVINSYMELVSKSKVQLSLLALNGEKYSKSARDAVNKNFQSMVTVVENTLKKTRKSTEKNLSVLAKNGLLSDKDMKAIEKKQQDTQKKQLKAMQDSAKKMVQINNDAYAKERKATKTAEDQIRAIKEDAAKRGQALTKQDREKIKKIEADAAKERKRIAKDAAQAIAKEEEKQRKNVVASLTKSEKQQKLILGRLKEESGKISAKQAADIVKNAEKARKGAVKEANDKYNQVKKAADEEYLVSGTITKKQHDEIVNQARKTRDETIANANEMKDKIVKAAKEQAKGHIKEVDWETGQTLTQFQQWGRGFAIHHKKVIEIINKILKFAGKPTIPLTGLDISDSSKKKDIPASAIGHNSHPGGHGLVGEEGVELAYKPFSGKATLLGVNGPEIANIEPGTRILNHKDTMALLSGGLGKGKVLPGYDKGNSTIGEFLDSAKSMASGIWSNAKDFTSQAIDFILHPVASAKKLYSYYGQFKNDIGNDKKLGSAIFNKLGDYMGDSLKEKFADFAGNWSGGAAAPAQVKQWLLTAMAITGTPASYLGALLKIAMHESGGNPRAINLWDSNAKAGHPSKGLMQTIDSTFNRYAIPGLGDIWNPVANAVAAIRYMNDRYGSISNVPGVKSAKYVGYKNGGRKIGDRQILVGENGPELVDLPSGSEIYNTVKTKELLKSRNGGINVQMSNVFHIKIEGGGDTTEEKIQRAVNAALEKAFKDLRGIIDTGIAY